MVRLYPTLEGFPIVSGVEQIHTPDDIWDEIVAAGATRRLDYGAKTATTYRRV